jgi:hypothetical protein
MLREVKDNGATYRVDELEGSPEFNRRWNLLSLEEQVTIEAEINRRLDELVNSPDPNWGSITNTSLEGGKSNPTTGEPGNWEGTPFQPLYYICGESHQLAGMFFGSVWKKVIIARREQWVGIRFDPTFPQRGIILMGKTYFLSSQWAGASGWQV